MLGNHEGRGSLLWKYIKLKYNEIVNFILAHGGTIADRLTNNTRYAVCPSKWIDWSTTEKNKSAMKQIRSECVPIVSENAFAYRWLGRGLAGYITTDDDFLNLVYDLRSGCNYLEWFESYGFGKVTVEYWQDGMWEENAKSLPGYLVENGDPTGSVDSKQGNDIGSLHEPDDNDDIELGIPIGIPEKIKGKTFVVTGKLIHFGNREALEEIIEEAGGTLSDSISSRTTALITNDPDSGTAKNIKARALMIPIISEDTFIKTYLEIIY